MKRTLAFLCGLAAVPAAQAAQHVARHAPPSPSGPVNLTTQPGSTLEGAARTLEAHDIAQSVAHGEQPLILVGSARLSTRSGAPAALFVQLQSAALCGSAGCETSVFLPGRNGGWDRVLDSVSGPIRVLPHWHGHMHDLLVGENDRWIWAGNAYRDTETAPALSSLKRSVERHQAAVARGDASPPK